MSAPSTDISQLSEEQQLALQQFTSVTDQDLDTALVLLQRCQWNAQIAITRFFDGDADVVDVPPPQDIRRSENLAASLDAAAFTRTRPTTNGLQQAPRVVPTPEGQLTQPAPFVLQLLFFPFNLTYSIFSRIFGAVGYLFPILPRLLHRLFPLQPARPRNTDRRPLNPRDTASRFIREFEEEYNVESNTIPFFENGYAQAFDLAKRELKYLLVILLSPEHDDTDPFVRDTLLSPEAKDFIQNHASDMIVWAGSLQDSEAYQVATALNVTKFPFTGLVVHTPSVSSTSMSLIARIAGPVPPSEFLAKMQDAMQKRDQELEGARRQRSEQQASRSLREEQNSAYERSLAQDRERARQRKEAEAAREKAEREERDKAEAKARKAQNILQWKKWRTQSLPEEPASTASDVVRISIRMPSGGRVIRKFGADAELEELYAFVECYDIIQSDEPATEEDASEPSGYSHEYEFQLVSPMPREVYGLDQGGTLKARVGRSANLIVEKLIDEEDEDEEESSA
ncbi:UBX-domain-containing protein [Aureobasidium pullulans]|uniref:UBX-domain-containing protein n=1 Tax=Aureobasidium pullulans TaxID=5580 RepID=A0A4S9XCX8_AURPU|nr:UBX-domain-containing protein [Aureobasidium pullulans]